MATIDTACPKCGAPHARKLSMIYEEGISTVQTDINTVGTMNTIGRQKIKTKGTSTSTQQTQASRDAAPPVVPELVTFGFKLRVIVMVVGVVFCIGAFLADAPGIAIIGIILGAGSFLIPAAPTEEEQRDYDASTKHLRAAKDAWANTFKCGSCGNKFVPSEVKAAKLPGNQVRCADMA